MSLTLKTNTIFLLLSCALLVKAYATEYSIDDVSLEKHFKTGNKSITIAAPPTKDMMGVAIDIKDKAINLTRVIYSPKNSTKLFNEGIYNYFLESFKSEQKKQDSRKNLKDKMSDSEMRRLSIYSADTRHSLTLSSENSQSDSCPHLPSSNPWDSDRKHIKSTIKSYCDILKGNQKWANQLILSKGNIHLLGTKFQLNDMVFGVKHHLVFEAPKELNSDIEKIIVTKLEESNYIAMNGTIDFSNPNIFTQTEGPDFLFQGAKDITLVFNSKLLPVFKPMTIVLSNGIKIQRFSPNSIQIGDGLHLSGNVSLNNAHLGARGQDFYFKNLQLKREMTAEEFLDAIRQEFGEIKEVIYS